MIDNLRYGMKTLVRRIYSPMANYLTFGEAKPEGFYTVNVAGESYDIWMSRGGRDNRKKLNGEYESGVVDIITDSISEDTVFWEVGTYQGYFALLAAELGAKDVVAFDANHTCIEFVARAAERNGFDRVQTVEGWFSYESIEGVPSPDIILIDIEGAEYDVLPSVLPLFDDTLIIVEVHSPNRPFSDLGKGDPSEIENLFYAEGYETRIIHRRNKYNFHILGKISATNNT